MQWLMFALIPGAMLAMMLLAALILRTRKSKAIAFMVIQLIGVTAVLVAAHLADDSRPNELFAQIVSSCVFGTLVGGYFFSSLRRQ